MASVKRMLPLTRHSLSLVSSVVKRETMQREMTDTDMGTIMEPPLISAEAGKSTEHCRFMNIPADPPRADATSNHAN